MSNAEIWKINSLRGEKSLNIFNSYTYGQKHAHIMYVINVNIYKETLLHPVREL